MNTRQSPKTMTAFTTIQPLHPILTRSSTLPVGQVCMTAGQIRKSDNDSVPIQAPKPSPPSPYRKVENRPELVGGLPLWFTIGAISGARRFLESFNMTPFATLRRRSIQLLERHVTSNAELSDTSSDLPAARVLRKVADVMEEELASLRATLTSMRIELAQSRAQIASMAKEIQFVKFRNAQKSDVEYSLGETSAHLRSLLCKEQTRAAKAEKQVMELKERLAKEERKSRLLHGDVVKVSIMYSSAMVVLVTFLAESPFGPRLLSYLMAGGH